MTYTIRKNNKRTAAFLVSAFLVGCTATGEVNWGLVKKFTGTLLHTAALNYTGSATASVDYLVAAFTGQEVQRPDQNQYPGEYDYGQVAYPEDPYAGAQYPGVQYPDYQDPYGQYPQQQDPYGQYPQQQDPYGQPDEQGTQSPANWEPWGDPFPDPYGEPVAQRNALSIDFALLRMIGNDFAVMPDGARLRDGVGRTEAGDRFGIAFATQEPTYVYIVSIDATGWAQTLFPYPDIPGYANPVAPGQPVLLPNEQLYGLDDARGIETIFVLASRTPNQALENALAPFAGMERSDSYSSRGGSERVSVPMVGQRGLVGITPGATRAQNASLDRYFTAPRAGELAFSRWFHHD